MKNHTTSTIPTPSIVAAVSKAFGKVDLPKDFPDRPAAGLYDVDVTVRVRASLRQALPRTSVVNEAIPWEALAIYALDALAPQVRDAVLKRAQSGEPIPDDLKGGTVAAWAKLGRKATKVVNGALTLSEVEVAILKVQADDFEPLPAD